MPRVNHVTKARSDVGTCGGCGKEIKKGDSYKWIKFRFGGKRYKCGDCSFKSSELTQSSFLGQVYDLNDRLDDLNSDMSIDEIKDAVEEIREEFSNLGNECDEKRNNMPEQLQDGDVGTTLQERYDTCESLSSDLEGVDFDWDEDAARTEAKSEFESETTEEERNDMDDAEKEEAIEEKVNEKQQERAQEILDELSGMRYDGP